MFHIPVHVRQVCALTLVLGAWLVTSGPAHAADWPLIAPSDLSSTKPRVDPAADAEVLLWDIRVTDSD